MSLFFLLTRLTGSHAAIDLPRADLVTAVMDYASSIFAYTHGEME
jgi:hypothetical protein